jgi:hypothetical protein
MPRLYVPDLQAAYSCRQTVPAFIDGRVYRNVEYATCARDAASTPATHRLEHSNVLCSCAPAGGNLFCSRASPDAGLTTRIRRRAHDSNDSVPPRTAKAEVLSPARVVPTAVGR